jgi:hypothetical protein
MWSAFGESLKHIGCPAIADGAMRLRPLKWDHLPRRRADIEVRIHNILILFVF